MGWQKPSFLLAFGGFWLMFSILCIKNNYFY